jgi:hypothetical protein
MADSAEINTNPTPYPEANEAVYVACAWLAAELGARLVGVYIAGSLALGDFDPIASDVDIVAVTTDDLDEADLACLAPLRAHLATHGGAWGRRVEMAIIARAAIYHWEPGQRVFFFTDHAAPDLVSAGPEWTIIGAILCTHGLTVSGPPPTTLIHDITDDEIIAAARATLRQTWTDFATNQPQYANTHLFQVFVVETMCRALMTIAGEGLPSKPVAIAWGAENLPQEWRALIAQARAWRARFTTEPDLAPEPETFPDTLRFIAYAVAHAGGDGAVGAAE